MDWVLPECDRHKTRDAANLLFAHYAPDKADPPLSERQVRALGEAGEWAAEEEVVEWTGSIVDRLRVVRDDIMSLRDHSARRRGGRGSPQQEERTMTEPHLGSTATHEVVGLRFARRRTRRVVGR